MQKHRFSTCLLKTCLLNTETLTVTSDLAVDWKTPLFLLFPFSAVFLHSSSFQPLWCGKKACAGAFLKPLKHFPLLVQLMPGIPHPPIFFSSFFFFKSRVTCVLSGRVCLWNCWTAACLLELSDPVWFTTAGNITPLCQGSWCAHTGPWAHLCVSDGFLLSCPIPHPGSYQ